MALSAVNDSHLPRASFQSLPPEIRELIWLETLTPRLVYLRPYDRAHLHHVRAVNHFATHCRCLETDVGFEHSIHTSSTTPAEAFAALDDIGAVRDQTPGPHTKSKTPDPPPALYVCQESRTIALKRGYRQAFKSVEVRWRQKSPTPTTRGDTGEFIRQRISGQGGIWLDLNRDCIMVDARLATPYRYPRRGFQSKHSIAFLQSWAPDDVESIRHLGLFGERDKVVQYLSVPLVPSPRSLAIRRLCISRELDKLETLWVDDTLDINMSSVLGRARKESVDSILHEFAIARSEDSEEIAPLPRVSVVRGQEWNSYFGN